MNKYRKFSKDTQAYMNDIEEYLIKRFGSVQDEWNLTLALLADNVELYKQCKESVSQNGIYDTSSGRKNPLLSTMKDLQASIVKQIQHLGISPYASAKIKDAEEDDSDVLKKLIGAEEEDE